MFKKTSKKEDGETITLQKSVLRGIMDGLMGNHPESEKSDKLEDEEEVDAHGHSGFKRSLSRSNRSC
jgi:hypothetical protein